MCKHRQIISLDEPQQIVDRIGDTVVMWWNEQREMGPQASAANLFL